MATKRTAEKAKAGAAGAEKPKTPEQGKPDKRKLPGDEGGKGQVWDLPHHSGTRASAGLELVSFRLPGPPDWEGPREFRVGKKVPTGGPYSRDRVLAALGREGDTFLVSFEDGTIQEFVGCAIVATYGVRECQKPSTSAEQPAARSEQGPSQADGTSGIASGRDPERP